MNSNKSSLIKSNLIYFYVMLFEFKHIYLWKQKKYSKIVYFNNLFNIMKTEYEVKILDIDFDYIKSKLNNLWAKYLWENIQKRYVYDFYPINPNKWIRLRQKWKKVELTIKEIFNDNIDWTKEIETTVWDFETTNLILNHLWYKAKSYQENKRISYILDWVEIEIDFWPKISPYIEIEWKNEFDIKNIVEKLWYKMEETTSINTEKVYEKYWINLKSIKNLTF